MKWLCKLFNFYVDGFRQMTWGRVLWVLILVKLFILFVVLRLLFFQPFLQGDDQAKQQAVASELTDFY